MPCSQTKKTLDMIELIEKDEMLIRKFAKLISLAMDYDTELRRKITAIVNRESARDNTLVF